MKRRASMLLVNAEDVRLEVTTWLHLASWYRIDSNICAPVAVLVNMLTQNPLWHGFRSVGAAYHPPRKQNL